jgi:YndJ-like protein
MPANRQMRSWCLSSAGIGAGIWVFYILATATDWNYFVTIERLLLLVVLVFTPLALALVPQWYAGETNKTSSSLLRWAYRLQPFAAILIVLAFTQPTGMMAASLSLPWLLCAGSIALAGLALRKSAHGNHPAHEIVLTIGMLYLPIGAVWLCLSRLGLRPLNFPDVIVLLTAVHFHYTGFVVPVITALTGRFLVRNHLSVPIYPWLAGAMVIATPLIAAGITLSPWLEALGVLLIFTTVIGLATVIGIYVLPQLPSRLARCLLTVAACAMVAAIIPALLYGAGEFFERSWITIPRMVQLHGFTNALGFVACGLTGWLVAGVETHPQAGELPLSMEVK